jgi:protein phosphatase 1 regulatory subunit 7
MRNIPEGLRHLRLLDTVYLVQNRITKIEGLDALGSNLRSLELGGNRIRVCVAVFLTKFHLIVTKNIEGLDALVNLEELWLGKNKITKLEV